MKSKEDLISSSTKDLKAILASHLAYPCRQLRNRICAGARQMSLKIDEKASKAEKPKLKPVKVAILSSYTAQNLDAPLKGSCNDSGSYLKSISVAMTNSTRSLWILLRFCIPCNQTS